MAYFSLNQTTVGTGIVLILNYNNDGCCHVINDGIYSINCTYYYMEDWVDYPAPYLKSVKRPAEATVDCYNINYKANITVSLKLKSLLQTGISRKTLELLILFLNI